MIRNVLKLKSIGHGCKKKVRQLTGMIKRCTDLYEQLTRCSLFDKRQNLTIRETRLIVDYLGKVVLTMKIKLFLRSKF